MLLQWGTLGDTKWDAHLTSGILVLIIIVENTLWRKCRDCIGNRQGRKWEANYEGLL